MRMAMLIPLLLASPALASPPWAEPMQEERLDADARSAWDEALQSWDRCDHETAILHLRTAASAQPDEPRLWLALARAAEDEAQSSLPREALPHLDVAEEGLRRLEALAPLPPEVQRRADMTRERVADRRDEVMRTLIALRDDPVSLQSIPGRMAIAPGPPSQSRHTSSASSSHSSRRGGRGQVIQVDIDAEIGGFGPQSIDLSFSAF